MPTNWRFKGGKPFPALRAGRDCASVEEWRNNTLWKVVGRFTVYFYPKDNTKVQVALYNNTSLTSLGHDIFWPPNELPNWDGDAPMSNVYQFWTWEETLP